MDSLNITLIVRITVNHNIFTANKNYDPLPVHELKIEQ